jgi:hypothetical protein
MGQIIVQPSTGGGGDATAANQTIQINQNKASNANNIIHISQPDISSLASQLNSDLNSINGFTILSINVFFDSTVGATDPFCAVIVYQ